MQPKEIEYFLAILKTGSISLAAKTLYISQPSLSQFLMRLENKIGTQLFDRSKTPWRLTETGKCYADYIDNYLRLQNKLQNDIHQIQTGNNTQQTLTVGVPSWKGTTILPSLLSRFADEFPNVTIMVLEEYADKLIPLLLNGTVDIGIMNTPYYNRHLTYEPLVDERILLVVSKEHQLVQGLKTSFDNPAYLDIRTIYDQQFILPTPNQLITREVGYMLAKAAVTPKRTMYISNILTCINLAAMGYGFTFVPEIGLCQCPNYERLAIFTPGRPDFTWPLSLVYRNEKRHGLVMERFINIAKEVLVSS